MSTNSTQMRRDASGLAYDVEALIQVCLHAHDNDTIGTALDCRGLSRSLEIAAEKAGELIERVEQLESALRKARTEGEVFPPSHLPSEQQTQKGGEH